ncbi:SA1788 family PVL leukocidin-associated protein [Staphylococcus pettenkoferi]|uniref:SA1788 family PVL leukocidin-associated protein n=1 Tax=Staphylococcus pettenkoferi TaxID=170573 RepID=UPI0024804FCB|nr:SA1788 family PVL leukocidin-associated protein [Staphylococcus pettenkoferi]MDH9617264.1 SA1788 family PVL leukocidin-associated protein [Staphylococcus pettenkoferi]
MGKTINLPKKKDNKGRLCYLTTDGAKPYYIPVDVYKDAVNVGMNHKEIKQAFKQGIRNLKRVIKYKEDPEAFKGEKEQEVKRDRRNKIERLARITQHRNVSSAEMVTTYKIRDDYWFENTFNQMFGKWGQRHANK